MFNIIFENIIPVKVPLISLLLAFSILSFFWVPIFNFFNLKPYSSIQRVHQNEISRLGGFLIYIFLWALWIFNFRNDIFLFSILISSIPFTIICLKEDLFQTTKPLLRLTSMLISCLIFFYIYPLDFPNINFPIIKNIIEIFPIGVIFFTFSILVLMNGMNMIDGLNGLFGFTALFQQIFLGSLAIFYNDIEMLNLIVIFSFPLVLFVFFNFPFGKLFAGDFGAYFYGFLNGMLTIYFFGKYNDLISWSAVLILFYPCMELLFSFIRKIINKTPPFDADDKHLHTLIYKKMLKKTNNKNLLNPYITLRLFIFWLLPSIFGFFFFDDIMLVSCCLVFLTILYICLYCIYDANYL